MKRIFTTFFLLTLVCLSAWAQAPQKMSYQAVVRDANNTLVANQNVSARISILQGSATGSAVYTETQTVATNANGLMTLSIGEGTVVSGNFGSIDWANGPYFLKSEIDPNGGISYTIESVQQLMSVPYALYAATSGNGEGPQGPAGPQGPQGETGAAGPQGPAGQDGVSPTVATTTTPTGTFVVITDASGSHQFFVANGADGAAGAQGPQGIQGATGPQGPAGADGTNGTNGADGRGILNIIGPISNGLIDTYTITYTDGTTSTFTVTNGAAGTNGTNGVDGRGILNIIGPISNGLIDTYTITYTDGTTSTFTVTNGAVGAQGPAGTNGTNGQDGFSPVVTTTAAGDSTMVTITDANGPHTFVLHNGQQGLQGPQGPAGSNGTNGTDGQDGFSPVVTTTAAGDSTVVTITDANGPHTFVLYNGQQGLQGPQGPAGSNGTNGTDGQDGFSPVVTTTAAGDSTMVTITDANGPHTFVLHNGQQGPQGHQGPAGLAGSNGTNGTDGQDGFSPTVTTTSAGDSTVVTITDANGPHTFVLHNGQQGPQGPQGETGLTGANGTDGRGIAYIAGPVSAGHVDTYTINYTDGTTSTFTVTNGLDGTAAAAGIGIDSIAKTGTEGLVDTYTITYTDGTTSTFTVTNGAAGVQGPVGPQGVQGETGATGATGPQGPAGTNGTNGADGRGIQSISGPVTNGLTDTYTINYTDGTTSTFTVTNGAVGAQGPVGPQGAQGETGATGPQGPAGANGTNGTNGQDGFSPVVTTTAAGDSTVVTITDANGPHTFVLHNGQQGPQGPQGPAGLAGSNGTNGTDGQDGFSPTVTTTAAGDSTVVTITDATGPHTFVVYNGQQGPVGPAGPAGANGTNGISPTVTAAAAGSNVIITVTDSAGTHTYTIPTTSGEVTQLPADWTATSGVQMILNKPNLATVATTGNYNDLSNTPTIPTVPTNVSAFTNDAGYLTSFTEQQVLSISNDTLFLTGGSYVKLPAGFDGNYNSLTNKPNLATVATTGNYNDLSNTPTIPTVPTNVSAFTNDAGYLTSYTETDPQFNAWDKNYNDLTNKPTLFSGNYNDLTNKPILFDGNYNSLTNKPNLATVATTGNYNDLVNKPTLFSGNYNDLTNKPTIPTVNNATLTIQKNGSNVGTFTANQNTNQTVNIIVPTTTSQLTNNSGFITNEALPTNVSQLNNDAGYITAAQCGDVDICALANLVTALQQQVADLQSQLDSMGLIVDTAITHVGFHCGISTVSDYDGNIYNTVKIGDQCWMKENLRTTHYPDGAEISELHYPNNEIGNVNTYGYLYKWDAMMHGASSTNDNPSGVQGICPTGWHVPSDAEWMQLTDYVKGQSVFVCGSDNNNIAKSLAASTDWDTDTADCTVGNNLTVNDATGFGALPAGYTLLSYSYNFGNNARYWSSTLKYTTSACYCNFSSNNSTVERPSASIGWAAYSVRCVLGEGTAAELPTVTTSAVSNITENAVACGGEVVAGGGADVTARGVCWSISPNPTVNDSHTTDGNGIGSFTSSITGLEVGIPYYVRAYATNSAGTVYGEEIKISIPSVNDAMPCSSNPTVTDYDGNVYNTVQIGAQCWMKENLRTTHYPDGAEIPMGTTASNTESFRYNPNNNANTVNTYGYLYNWPAVMHGAASSNSNPSGVQGVCPSGWHVPSDAEWTQLTDYVSCQSGYVCGTNSSFIAKALAATIGWASDTAYCAVGNDQTNNNATGFTALPAGYCWGFYGSFTYQQYGSHAFYSSSTQSSSSRAYGRFLKHDFAEVVVNYNDNKLCGLSVRCVLGEGTTAEIPTVTTSTVSNITDNAATCGGEVVTDGDTDVTARGVCWSTSQNPTINDSHTTNGSGTGSFASSITGLSANTTYYVRAYATNSVGTAYGAEVSFTTIGGGILQDGQSCPGTPTITDHEGNVYNTVQIGNQCWTKENLRTTTSPSTGTYLIPTAGTGSTYTGKQARWYNDDSITYAPRNYGLLYNWNAAVDTFNTAYGETYVNTSNSNAVSVTFSGHRRGICPEGWHLPSDAEWIVMIDYVSSRSEYMCDSHTSYIAKALADSVGWYSSTNTCAVGNNQSVNNAIGFSAVPAGGCTGSSFYSAGDIAYFWSSSQSPNGSLILRNLSLKYNNPDASRNGDFKHNGCSVRCLRD